MDLYRRANNWQLVTTLYRTFFTYVIYLPDFVEIKILIFEGLYSLRLSARWLLGQAEYLSFIIKLTQIKNIKCFRFSKTKSILSIFKGYGLYIGFFIYNLYYSLWMQKWIEVWVWPKSSSQFSNNTKGYVLENKTIKMNSSPR